MPGNGNIMAMKRDIFFYPHGLKVWWDKHKYVIIHYDKGPKEKVSTTWRISRDLKALVKDDITAEETLQVTDAEGSMAAKPKGKERNRFKKEFKQESGMIRLRF